MDYTKPEFIKTCVKSGYAERKNAYKYCAIHEKETYTDDDLIEVYRMEQEQRFYQFKKNYI